MLFALTVQYLTKSVLLKPKMVLARPPSPCPKLESLLEDRDGLKVRPAVAAVRRKGKCVHYYTRSDVVEFVNELWRLILTEPVISLLGGSTNMVSMPFA